MKVHEFMHEMRTTSAILGRTSGISVVFEGDEAKTDGKTIYLPALPHQADLTQEQVMAMRGYVDHEAGHNRHSDMDRIISFYDKNQNNGRPDLNGLHNSLEDVWMEEKVLDEYPGAWKNLRQTHELARRKERSIWDNEGDEKIRQFLKDSPNEEIGMGITLHKNDDFNTESVKELQSRMSDEVNAMGKHYAQLARDCADSSEVIELAKRIYQYNSETPPQNQTPEDFDQKAQAGDLDDLAGEEAEGPNSSNYREGQGEAEARKGKAKGQGEGKGLKEATQDMGEVLTAAGEDAEGAGGIGTCMDNGLRGGYRVYTTVEDETFVRGGDSKHRLQAIVDDLDHITNYDAQKATLRSDVMVMKNKLRRALMARQQRDWDFGREYGRLDSKRLVAASQGVKQVWKRRTEREDHDTAISILIDLSGSMGGQKAETARDCAIALSECFEGTQMSYRISGFYNAGMPRQQSRYTTRNETKGLYHRYEKLAHPVFKDYDDSLRVTRGSVYMIDQAVGGNNSDYDFVDRELYGLSRRPEARKVLFVLSDGHVACMSDAPSYEHNKLIKQNLKYYKSRHGVESVGIGIMSNAVEDIYPDNVVVQSVSDLSGACFNMLTDILFRDQRNG